MLPFKPATFAAAVVVIASGLSLSAAPRAAAQSPNSTPSVSAAPASEGPRQEGGDRREEFRQRMEERLKSQLKASDDEWTVIQPLVEKVYEKQRAAGNFGGPGGPGGPRPDWRRNREGGQEAGNDPRQATVDNNNPGGNRPQRREGGPGGGPRGGTPEAQALRAALADDNTTVNDIKTKLQAVRDQRKQATTELTQAREELRKVLNMRQEATLVMYGLLD